jgi:tetratricopeptide (TPR) repeat protein
MRQWIAAAVLLGLVGCVTTDQDQLVRTYNEDGVQLFRSGDYPHARECFQAALALRPEDPDLLFNVGRCYDRVGTIGQAEQFYNQCLGRAPNHVACRHAQAILLVKSGRSDDAARMVQDWLAREPQRAAAYAEDGWLWRERGDLPRAQARLQQALELDPHDNRALVELGQVYEAMHRPDRALVLYERVLERDPHDAEAGQRTNALLAAGAGRPHPE